MDWQKLIVEKALDLVVDRLDDIISGIRSHLDARREQRSVETREAFRNYFETTIRRCARIKTILYRAEPVWLYDLYIHMNLRAANDQTVPTAEPEFISKHGPHIILSGGAGSGKSTLLRHLFLSVIEHRLAVPLYLELRTIDSDVQDFAEILHHALKDARGAVSLETFKELLVGGRFCVLLDGFDEIATTRVASVSRALGRFVDTYPKTSVLITSRPDAYRFVGWAGFHELCLQPLTRNECLLLISKLKYDSDVKLRFCNAVRDRLFATHGSFLSNPLLATLLLMTFDQFGDVESRRHIFYAQAFDTLLIKHDATKDGYRRELSCRLDSSRFKGMLGGVAAQAYYASEYRFTYDRLREWATNASRIVDVGGEFRVDDFIDDVTTKLSFLVQDGLELEFAHLSFLEYFTADFIVHRPREQRRQMMTTIRSRLMQDQVGELVYEIDRAAFEDDFLVPSVEELRSAVGWPQSDQDFVVAFFAKSVVALEAEVGFLALTYTPFGSSWLPILEFIRRKYPNQQPVPFYSIGEVYSSLSAALGATRDSGVTRMPHGSGRVMIQAREFARQLSHLVASAMFSVNVAVSASVHLPEHIRQERTCQEHGIRAWLSASSMSSRSV